LTDNDNKAKELTGRERSLANLAPPINLRSPEEQAEIRRKGGIARGKQMQRAKNLRELANMMMESKVSKEKARSVLGDLADEIPEEDLTNGALIIGSMINEVYENKTAKAAEFVRDTSGQRPKDQVELTAEVMTDTDRSLMADIAERLGIMHNKKDE